MQLMHIINVGSIYRCRRGWCVPKGIILTEAQVIALERKQQDNDVLWAHPYGDSSRR